MEPQCRKTVRGKGKGVRTAALVFCFGRWVKLRYTALKCGI